jgi:hypothetical protein
MRRGDVSWTLVGFILLGIAIIVVALIASGQAHKLFFWADKVDSVPRP